jgi:TolC family type I secretion outer membrane protein
MRKFILFSILSLLPAALFAQTDTLTVFKCVQIALRNNPQIRLSEGAMELSQESLVTSRSVLFPQLSMQSGFTRSGGAFVQGPTMKTTYFYNYSVGLQGQQLIYDFGKSFSKISASADLLNASMQDLLTTKQTLIANTYQAYYTFLEARRLKEATDEVLQQALEHLQQTEAFFNVGTKPEFDVLKARSDVDNAKVNQLNAENNLQVSRLQLENTLNQKLADNAEFSDNLASRQDSVSEEAAMETAMANRPEIVAGKLRLNSASSMVTNAWAQGLPVISANGAYNWKSLAYNQTLQDSWSFGLTFSLPLFQGFALDAGIDQAKTNVKIADAQFNLTEQSVTLDVRQQYYNLKLALSRIEASTSLLKQAKETLKLADARYLQGVGSAVEVTDARVGYFNAQVTNIQALFDYQVAFIRLQKAMGVLK